MTSTPAWLYVLVFPLMVGLILQFLLLFYGDAIKTWRAQRSVEKMKDRVQQLQLELDEAHEVIQSLPVFLWRVTDVVYIIAVAFPSALITILALLTILLFDLNIEDREDYRAIFGTSSSYLNPYFLLFVPIVGSWYLVWSVFFAKPFSTALKRLRNVVEYNKFKVEAEKAITHLEGRIKRLEK